MILGITGNSGSGKSHLSQIISKRINAQIIDADEIVKELSEPGNNYYNKIIELFGKQILKENKLNKKQIAQIIYNDSEKRENLNKLTYKYVVEEIKKRVEKSKQKNIIIDAPLLFESSLDKICNKTIAILADFEIKLQRITNRDKIDKKIAKARLDIQPNDEYYKKNADYIIKNNGKIDEAKLEEICTKIGMN